MGGKPRPKLKCASWCGRGCTQAEYDRACLRASALVKELGPGWKPRVWENLGWHYCAVSECGRLKVHAHHWAAGGEVASYSAFLGDPESPGGTWAENGNTAKEALAAVVQFALDDLEWHRQIVAGLEHLAPQKEGG